MLRVKRKIIAYNFELADALKKLDDQFEVQIFDSINPKTDPAFINALKDVEGIVGLALPADKELLERAPKLKIVSNNSTGYNNLSIEYNLLLFELVAEHRCREQAASQALPLR